PRPWWRVPLLEVLVVVLLGAVTNVFTGLLPASWAWAHDLKWMGTAFGALAVLAVVVALVRQRHDLRTAAQADSETVRPSATQRSAAAHTISGVVATGNHVTIHQGSQLLLPHPALPAAVPAPGGLIKVRAGHGTLVGRARQLQQLDQALAKPGAAVVHGLGGVGKSALAATWALHHHDRSHPVWWIDADTPAGIDADLAGLATALRVSGQALSLEELREFAVQWLAAHDGWLLILDNVNDPAHVSQLLDRVKTGRVLITTRRATGWAGIAAPIPLEVLDPADAIEMMWQRIAHDGRTRDRAGLDDLCRELGCLPLAVQQAASYLSEAGVSPREYLRLLRTYPAELFDHGGEGSGERTIARIWRVTLDQLADTPLAGSILRLLAWYAPDAIPRMVLAGLAEPPALNLAIRRLAAYSMVTAGEDVLHVHRLVQAVARTADPTDPHRQLDAIATARTHAAAHLQNAMPGDWIQRETWNRWRVLAPHVEALAHHSPPELTDAASARIYNDMANFLQSQGAVGRAIALHERALEDRRRLLGDDDPDTLTSINNLACASRTAGDLRRAISLHEQALEGRRRVLGNDHPDTLTSLNNLAYAHRTAGDPRRAISLHEQALEGRRRVLGNDHPDTLTSLSNLAYAHRTAGDVRRAIPLYETALTERRRVLGNDHPDTLTSVNNLAFAYRTAGDLNRAIPLYETALTERRRVLGNDHPDTLISVNNLAFAYRTAGDLRQAISLYEQALEDRRRVLGDDHPSTMISVNNLAGAYLAAGDLQRAIALHERALADRRRVLGDDHPSTMSSIHSLATAYESAVDLDQAISLHKQALADRLRVLGDDHPDTLRSLCSLATAYESAGDPGQAIPLYEQACAGYQRVLGADHPTTKAVRSRLGAASDAAAQ
ncbi:MAG TPA: tetratricopeptide repeat protein, partial [Actinoplanes sp.]|nr:tetratricopeptide repeat protein [Actinoplanes sp.]